MTETEWVDSNEAAEILGYNSLHRATRTRMARSAMASYAKREAAAGRTVPVREDTSTGQLRRLWPRHAVVAWRDDPRRRVGNPEWNRLTTAAKRFEEQS